ncbi:MAG: aminotransferase class I/II-fold pyridoxal phosphate-dependent enzyme [Candidatus Helarchaeota archaeon]
MKFEPSEKVKSIGSYAFADVDKIVDELKSKGITPIDFGVGDPKIPTPNIVREAIKLSADKRQTSGYPGYIGSLEFRATICEWMKKRFNIKLDPEKEVTSSLGGKECVFNFPMGFVNPGDVVFCPNPGYPPAERGTIFAGGRPVLLPLEEKNDFLIDFDAIDKELIKKAKILWINYPSNPTNATATEEFFKEAIDFGHDNNIIIASDEVYSEIYFDKKPRSILEFTHEGVVVVQSLSKRSAMTAYRVGWLAGDEDIISVYKKVKTNIDSGTSWLIQDAAIAALRDEKHVEEMRNEYKIKRDIMVNVLKDVGLKVRVPKATFYIWQKTPQGMSSLEFTKKLLAKEMAIVTTPGSWISKEVNGLNPGEGYVRFALVPSIEETKDAAKKIREFY